jgi:predicted O-methyltransferase YrrM
MNRIKRLVGITLDRTLIPFMSYIRYRTYAAIPVYTVQQELAVRTAAECADYVQTTMPMALQFDRREDLWDHAWKRKNATGLIAEFGVWNGYSINQFARKTKQAVYGFDSFTGLREDWSGAKFARGKFDLGGKLPKVEANVELFKGWFDDTLPGFLANHKDHFALIHVDCDTYEATKIVLDLVGPRIQAGSIIIFDEYFGYRGWRCGEYKAWQEFVSRNQIGYKYLAFSTSQVSVQVTQTKILPPSAVQD